jgi:phospholipid transport system transporter-binding protein
MKPSPQLQVISPEIWQLSGELSLKTVMAVLNEITLNCQQGFPKTINLEQVSRTDSAGLALLIEIMRLAHQKQQVIHFSNPPPQLQRIAQAVGLIEILAT